MHWHHCFIIKPLEILILIASLKLLSHNIYDDIEWLHCPLGGSTLWSPIYSAVSGGAGSCAGHDE